MIQLLVYRGFYCSVKLTKNPLALIFLLPLQLSESADPLHVSRLFTACMLPGMDDTSIYCCD